MSQTQHGTPAWYWECDCQVCQRARAESPRKSPQGMVPIDAARWHVNMLMENGHTLGSIAACSGVRQRLVCSIRNDDYRNGSGNIVRYIKVDHHDAILGVTINQTPDGSSMVPVTRLRPLIFEMHRVGYTYRWIGKTAHVCNLSRVMTRGLHVKKITWLRVMTLYRILATQGIVDASLLDEGTCG